MKKPDNWSHSRFSRQLAAFACVMLLGACGTDDTGGQSDAAAPGEKDLPFVVVVDDFEDGALLSVAAADPKDVWIVGGEKHRSVALHYDGEAWQRRDPPTKQQLWWVHRFGPGEVVTVGESGAVALFQQATWTVLAGTSEGVTYYGAWGTSPDDFWAVGGPWARAASGVATPKQVLTHFIDGKPENTDVSQLLGKSVQSLFKVWGTGTGRLFVVGDGGSALLYDGTQWRKTETDLVGVVLFTVTGTKEAAWAIGGLGQPALLRWQPSATSTSGTWSDVELPSDVPLATQGIAVEDGQTLWISGWDGYVARSRSGQGWDTYSAVTDKALHAISVSSDGTVWSVGGDIQTLQDDYKGAIVARGNTIAAVPKSL